MMQSVSSSHFMEIDGYNQIDIMYTVGRKNYERR